MLRILRIKAEKVHSYIPVDIVFNEQLTFLTGSNGCGKTTVLKLISAILQPNFDILNEIEFKLIRISFINNGVKSFIELKKGIDDNNFDGIQWRYYIVDRDNDYSSFEEELFEDKNDIKKYNAFKSGFFKLYQKRRINIFNRDESLKYRENIYNEFINSRYFEFIQKIYNPIHLGINRQLIGSEALNRNKLFGYQNNNQEASFRDAERIVVEYVSGMADERKNLIETFKSNIFRSLFEYIPLPDSDDIFTKIDEKSFKSRKLSTLLAIKNLELSNEIADEIEIYYNSLKTIQPKVFGTKKDDRDIRELNEWFVNRAHLQRIEAISKYAQTYQHAIDKLDLPLKEITKIANSFLNESNKNLKINASGKLNVVWSEKEVITDNLSSGEMQLILIIVHLVFCEFRKESSIFMIDEPELSLHLSWQEKFVDAILHASPSTQFILATHSPAIISTLENEEKAIYLNNI